MRVNDAALEVWAIHIVNNADIQQQYLGFDQYLTNSARLIPMCFPIFLSPMCHVLNLF